jgi:hypothetical protein
MPGYESHTDEHLRNGAAFHERKLTYHGTELRAIVEEQERRVGARIRAAAAAVSAATTSTARADTSMLEHRVRTLEGRIASLERKTARKRKAARK